MNIQSAHLGSITSKRCSKGDTCVHPQGPVLPITEFDSSLIRRGFQAPCKYCRSFYRGHKHREVLEIPEGYKLCSKREQCVHVKGPILPATNEYFGADKSHTDGFHPSCKACKRKSDTQYFKANVEKVRASSRQYIKAHPEQSRIRIQQWCRANTARHRLIKRAASQRRRALMRNLPAVYTDRDWQNCLTYFNNRCAICDRPSGFWHKLAQDHWIPVSKGGSYTPGNIIPLCHGIGGCNNSKNDSDAHEWLISRFGKRKASQIEARVQAYFDSLTSKALAG